MKMGLEPDDTAEVAQRLRTRLLVPVERKPAALTSYEGRGPLLAWLRICASRQALMLRRSSDRHRADALPVEEAAPPLFEPELQALKADARAAVKRAFEAAFARLEPRDKALLAYHLADGLSLREIGGIVGADASTISRRLARARQWLLEETERDLATARDHAGDLLSRLRCPRSGLVIRREHRVGLAQYGKA